MSAQQVNEKRQHAASLVEQAEKALGDSEMDKYGGLIGEAEGLLKEANDLEAAETRLQVMKGDLSQSTNGMPLRTSGDVRVEGFEKSGETILEGKESASGTIYTKAAEAGDGLYSAKAYNTARTADYKKVFDHYLRQGKGGLSTAEEKVLQEGSDQSGGFLVPEDIMQQLIVRKPAPTNVAPLVRRFPTSRDSVVIPQVNYTTDNIHTTGIRVTWTGEIPASSTAMRVTEPVFGQVRIPVYTAMMSMPITNNLVEDAMFPVQQYASDRFSEEIDILYDAIVLNGTGIGQPSGILVNPGATNNPPVVNSASAASLTADALIALWAALPPQYDTNARFIFNKNSAALTIAQLKDGNGRYLWGSGLQDSGLIPNVANRELLGNPVLINQQMPNIGAGNFPIIFGDLQGYFLVERVGFSIQVLRELYAESNEILLLGRLRFGGAPVEYWRFEIQKCSL